MSSKKTPAKKTPAKNNTAKARKQRAPAETVPVETTTPETTTPATAPIEQPAAQQTPVAPAPQAETVAEEKPKGREKEKAAPTPKKLSAIDAAAQVLAEATQPMNCQEMIDAMSKKKLWTTPGGQTPHATLYSAILREIAKKGKESRFTKTERGKFARTDAV
jgi:hypothetical protein